MALILVVPASLFHQNYHALYKCEKAGDELPLHSHMFNHTTWAMNGDVEIFDETGPLFVLRPGDGPVEYIAGRQHGIRGLTDGAMFLNISPVLT